MLINTKPKLSSILKERGMTQLELSTLSGVPQGSISRFDKNDRHVDWHVFSIARALGLSAEDLFSIEEAK